METRMIDLRLMKKKIEELEVLEGRIKAGQDVPELVRKMIYLCMSLKFQIDEYRDDLIKELI